MLGHARQDWWCNLLDPVFGSNGRLIILKDNIITMLSWSRIARSLQICTVSAKEEEYDSRIHLCARIRIYITNLIEALSCTEWLRLLWGWGWWEGVHSYRSNCAGHTFSFLIYCFPAIPTVRHSSTLPWSIFLQQFNMFCINSFPSSSPPIPHFVDCTRRPVQSFVQCTLSHQILSQQNGKCIPFP